VDSATLLAIPFAAYLLARFLSDCSSQNCLGGGDVRKAGSGNIGATNVARVAGRCGILTLVFDTAKGAAAVWLAGRVTNESATWMMIGGFAVLLGHCFPVWLKFKGGKGVATALECFLPSAHLQPSAPSALSSLPWPTGVMFRWVPLAAAAAMPLLIYFLWAPRHAAANHHRWGNAGHWLLVIYKHDGNLQRLVEGTERAFLWQEERSGVTKIAILGGGGWGTALAIVLSRSRKAHEISLGCATPDWPN